MTASNTAAVPDGWIAIAIVGSECTSVAFKSEQTARAMCVKGEPFPFWIQPAAAPLSGWISVDERLPEVGDYSVFAYFAAYGGFDMVHVEQYFENVTDGIADDGSQKYAKWYVSAGVTHWMLPTAPGTEAAPADLAGAQFAAKSHLQTVQVQADEIAALKVKCDLLSASLKQADAVRDQLVAALQLAGNSAGFQYMTYETQSAIELAIAAAGAQS